MPRRWTSEMRGSPSSEGRYLTASAVARAPMRGSCQLIGLIVSKSKLFVRSNETTSGAGFVPSDAINKKQLVTDALDADQPGICRFVGEESVPIHHGRGQCTTEDLGAERDVNLIHEA